MVALVRSFATPQVGGFLPVALPAPEESLFFAIGQIYNTLTLKAQASNFRFIYASKFSLGSNTAIRLKLTDPYGNYVFIDPSRLSISNDDISTGNAAFPTIGGGTYMQFMTSKTDFPFAGVWSVEGLYISGETEIPGDKAYFVVGDSFYG